MTLQVSWKGLEDARDRTLRAAGLRYRSSLASCFLGLQDLIDDLKSELSGNFERVIVGMMTPTVLYDVEELRRAMKVCAFPLSGSSCWQGRRWLAFTRNHDKDPLRVGRMREFPSLMTTWKHGITLKHLWFKNCLPKRHRTLLFPMTP